MSMPGATTSTMLFYVYVLEGQKDSNKYVGFISNLRKRLEEHQNKKVFSTKPRLPMQLIYFEVCTNKDDAMRREYYLKSTKGRRFLAKRLKSFYQSKL